MKTSMKKYLSLVLAICCLFACFIIPEQAITASAAASYSETEFGEGTFLITTEDSSGNLYYLPAATSTGSGPAKKTFTDVSEISEDNLWTVTSAGDGKYYIQNSAGQYLNTTSSNSGVRVSTTKDSWIYDSKENSLKSSSQSRYLGVYTNGSDWRCYTTVGQSNYSGTSKNFKFYKVNTVDNSISEPLNAVNSYMSLGYKYTASTQTVELPSISETTDVLNPNFIGIKGSSYANWTKVGASGATYTGYSSAGNSTDRVQLNNKNNYGIIAANKDAKVTKIVVTWNTGTTSGRKIDIYGKDTPYSSTADLYSTSTKGTLIGSITYGTSTTLEITGDYKYIGIVSNNGALYMTDVSITWQSGSAEGGSVEKIVCSGSEFALRCSIDDSIANIAGIDSYGIKVTAGEKSVEYTTSAKSWVHDEENGLFYITLNLGDIINNIDNLTTEFTVEAYVKVGTNVFTSENSKTYSIVDMVKTYKAQGIAAVDHFYSYLEQEDVI